MLGIFSPCLLPFLPAYFSYTFKEKKNITKMTLVFALGFSIVFVIMGVIAGFLGSQIMGVVQSDWLISIAGIFIIIFGVMSLQGKGFSSFIKTKHKIKNDIPGTFLLGVFFAIGWTACLGPILAGILGIGAILNNILYSGMLLLFYSFGNLVPLFVLSIFYDKFNLANSKLMKGKEIKFSFAGKKYHVHSTNLISGILFLVIGFTLLIFKGTAIVNKWDVQDENYLRSRVEYGCPLTLHFVEIFALPRSSDPAMHLIVVQLGISKGNNSQLLYILYQPQNPS